VLADDPRPAYPEISESDNEFCDILRAENQQRFIEYDRPEHLEMRKVMHAYFTLKPMEEWRLLVRSAIVGLLDAAEARGNVDLMRDLAVPLPVLVIAEMMGVPASERPHIRVLTEKLLHRGGSEPDPHVQGITEMNDYASPIVKDRMVNPKEDFISVLADGEKSGVSTRDQVLGNAALLLLAGHGTTIGLTCNGTLSFMTNRDQ